LKAVRNLVLGSAGFIGKPLTDYLRACGEHVVDFDVKNDPSQDARSAQLKLEGIDRVYFLAWEVGGAKYLYRDDIQHRQLDWNLSLMLNVMPQLQQSGVDFLFVSSQLAEETDTVYGVTKRLGEVWTHLLGGTRVRLWNVYGPVEQPNERSHVVADFVHQALRTGEIQMLTDGSESRQFVHIDDVCRALHLAQMGNLDGVYDVTSFEWVPVREVADLIAEETGAKVRVGDVKGSTPITPMKGKVPGWRPEVPLNEGLARMVHDARQG
jgi:nucleoside-diphosphate-sugar epimerase